MQIVGLMAAVNLVAPIDVNVEATMVPIFASPTHAIVLGMIQYELGNVVILIFARANVNLRECRVFQKARTLRAIPVTKRHVYAQVVPV